jgi:hypothetical protein
MQIHKECTMTWNTFHRRGEILQAVVEAADARLDGVLPVQLPGVDDTFHDELDLVAALWLKWNARLSGNIERALTGEPMDLEEAVASGWRVTRDQLPGVRLVLDRYVESPTGPDMAAALERARDKEWCRLAAAAGLANDESPAAARAGRQIELRARLADAGSTAPSPSAAAPTNLDEGPPSLVDRIKAVLAA